MITYLSSTQLDLAEHRSVVAAALRQAGHGVVYMEEYSADDARPLKRCIDDVAAADLYVGILTWRYGHSINPGETDAGLPGGIVPGGTSITEAEVRAAHAIPRVIFLAHDTAPWPPTLMDAHTADDRGAAIKRLRTELAEKHVVSLFNSPDQLAREVLAAVRRREEIAKIFVDERCRASIWTVADEGAIVSQRVRMGRGLAVCKQILEHRGCTIGLQPTR